MVVSQRARISLLRREQSHVIIYDEDERNRNMSPNKESALEAGGLEDVFDVGVVSGELVSVCEENAVLVDEEGAA